MVPLPVFWTKYTATVQGRSLKIVPCENCSTRYVYVLEREGTGVGTSMYSLNNEGAAGHAASAAGETLSSALENDFDPVPCPVCGHYQKFMFPKLVEGKWVGLQALRFMLLLSGCLVAAGTLYRSAAYLLSPSEPAWEKMVTAWSVLLLLGLVTFGLSALHRYKVCRFDPNQENQQTRIAIGRSRAITVEEMEKAQQEEKR